MFWKLLFFFLSLRNSISISLQIGVQSYTPKIDSVNWVNQ